MEVITASVSEEDGDAVVLLSDACEEYNVPAAQAIDISVILQELAITLTLTHSNYNPHSPITLVPSFKPDLNVKELVDRSVCDWVQIS